MNKHHFILEINESIPGIELKDEDIVYDYKDTSNLEQVGGSVLASVGPDTGEITITYKGKTNTYLAGDGTTFPNEFIKDYNSGVYN